jgi:tetratricopeptide (TPR) repeat protein
MNETSMVLWDSVVDEFVRGVAAPADFFRPGVDRVALIRRALALPGGNNRAAAVALLRQMSLEEKQLLFPELIRLARSAHGPVGAVREIIFSLPREWVLERIDAQVEPILRNEEYDDYWMFLELYEKLDPMRAVKLARRAAGSADAAIREFGLERLANLVATAAADTPEAETLRAALGPIWQGATNHKRERMRGLAEDLCALAEAGPKVVQMSPSDAADWQAEAQAIRDSVLLGRDLDKALTFLRRPHPPIQAAPDVLPWLQAKCWEQLGDDETALVFYREAARLDRRNAAAIITILEKLRRFEEAAEVGASVIRSSDAGPEELYAATSPLLALTRGRPRAEANMLFEQVIKTLRRAKDLTEEGACSAPPDELRRRISFALAACLRELGRADEARQTLDAAIAKAPQDPILLSFRGYLRAMTDPAGALSDFASAVRYGAASFWPFFFLSRHALQKGAWAEALASANRAMEFAAVPIALAEAYEVIAIAQSKLGLPAEEVVANFDRAVALAPSNDRIRNNREVARGMLNKPQARADLQAELHQPEGEPWQLLVEVKDRMPISTDDLVTEHASARW